MPNMAETHAFDFLKDEHFPIPAVCAIVGTERFLKRLSLARIRQQLSEDGSAIELGPTAQWRDVRDELATRSLFGDGPRVVVIEEADDFVKEHRPQLEALVANPITGCLILDLSSFLKTTKLYSAVIESGLLIDCNPPQTLRGKTKYVDETRLCQWIRDWGQSVHRVNVKRGADEELLALVGPTLGMLDQELAKLALFCTPNEPVTVDMVKKVVGGWRAQTTWDLIDAVLDGNAADALLQLDRLLQSGEPPQMILGGMLWSLRRFASAAHFVIEAEAVGRKLSLPKALERAGFRSWPQGAMERADKQIRQLGRDRAAALFDQLLQLDLAMKGSHSAPDLSRWALEQFILSLSKAARAA